MAGEKLTVACAQTGSVEEGTSLGDGIEKAKRFLDEAAGKGAEIVVFPELFLAPFFPNRLRTDIDKFFIELTDSRFLSLAGHCRDQGIAAVIPVAERHRGSCYNSAVLVDERGAVAGIYRKTHIPAYFPNDRPGGTGSYEKFYFTPGETLPVITLRGRRCGVQICNDRLYPEASRVLAMQGAEIIVMPISYSTYSRPEERASIWEVPLRSRAMENGVFVIAANRVGIEGERHHLGRSMIVRPSGMIQAEASSDKEEVLVGEIDMAEVQAARLNFPWWRDRRPSLYEPVAALG